MNPNIAVSTNWGSFFATSGTRVLGNYRLRHFGLSMVGIISMVWSRSRYPEDETPKTFTGFVWARVQQFGAKLGALTLGWSVQEP